MLAMTSKWLIFVLEVLSATAIVLAVVRIAVGMIGKAKQSPPGVGAVAWALLFLTSFRMPPPPPATQIEVDIAGKKDREGSRDVGEP